MMWTLSDTYLKSTYTRLRTGGRTDEFDHILSELVRLISKASLAAV